MIPSRAVMGFEWSFMALAYITVACRTYVRVVMRKARLFSADYWLILGLLSCQGLLICDTLTYSMNAMDNFTIDNVAIRKGKRRTEMYIFHINDSCADSVVYELLIRGPKSRFAWPVGPFSLISDPQSDVAYPIPLLATLKITSTRKKIGLAVVFSLGVITIAVSVGRFITMAYVDNAISIYIWATAEICISVIVVALTAVWPLLRKLTNLKSTTILTSEDRSGV
ncbi:hypothetical protein H9Q69_007925 [Fusarium xylarioides]|uniref:Rhodopsin domain-containing protein n=1 Tax=Fusarium xylarioides TaxID=221167 RepID=A0A9P7HZV1_9HYPO|nr:hypothetical protein H9Q72_005304 [Fusarium xylarioides]KAG5793006.1 hypothetical protein H9Q69_007925 [Fusarium xylarioides]